MQYLKKEVRDRIVSSAIGEFKTFGFNDSSVRNIATNAGISLGNVYRYYESKEDLYCAVSKPLLDNAKAFVESKEFAYLEQDRRVDKICEFFITNGDLVIVTKKGTSDHVAAYYDQFVKICAKAVEETARTNQRLCVSNPDFYQTIADAYVGSLAGVLSGNLDLVTKRGYIKEITLFFFKNI